MESEDAKRARAARFRAEAKQPPPPLPVQRIAHPGGKIVTGNKDACLRKLLQRKLNNGEELTTEQLRALRTLQPSSEADCNVKSTTKARHQPVSKVPPPQQPVLQTKQQQTTQQQPNQQPNQQSPPPQSAPTVCPEKRKLLKRLRQIEELEAKRAEGATLEANQEAKLLSKPALLAELSNLA